MPNKTKVELQTELPILIKSKGLVSPTKTTGDSLREMLLDIIDSMGYGGEGVPEGAICEWYSTVDTIPQYWVLCDGRFGSPDLRDKFVIGAGSSYAPDDTGGSSIHTHTGTVGDHILTLAELPGHTHGYRAYVQSGSNDGSGGEAAGYFEDKQTDSAGGGQGHSHPLNLSSSVTLPPYHSLVYMMFKGVNFTEDTEVPSQVLSLVVSSETISSFVVSWASSTDNVGVIGYDVYVNGVYRDTTSSLSMLINGLDPSTSYTINVKARDAGGNTSIDSTTTVTTLDSLPPSQVTNLLVTSITTNSFNVSWDLSTDNIGVIGYDIYLNGSYFDTTSSLSYSFTSLNSSSNYSIIIKARDAEGNVSSDTSTTVTTLALPPQSNCFCDTCNIGETCYSITYYPEYLSSEEVRYKSNNIIISDPIGSIDTMDNLDGTYTGHICSQQIPEIVNSSGEAIVWPGGSFSEDSCPITAVIEQGQIVEPLVCYGYTSMKVIPTGNVRVEIIGSFSGPATFLNAASLPDVIAVDSYRNEIISSETTYYFGIDAAKSGLGILTSTITLLVKDINSGEIINSFNYIREHSNHLC